MNRGVLFFGAHPDDETVMAGGTLAALHEHGFPTHIVCATDGRGGESGPVIEADTPENRAAIRIEELRCAAVALGTSSLTILGYEDPVIGPGEQLFGFPADEETLVQQYVSLIRDHEIDVVLSHGSNGEYGHPAHIQTYQAVRRAVLEFVPDVLWYTVAARVPDTEDRLWNQDDPADLALGITPWKEAKIAAMICHRTQHDLFKRRRNLTDVRDAVRLIEPFRRQWPASRPIDDPFFRFMLEIGARRFPG
jgi:LmbE family N-acetylglucosaminyl deacetylase